ncbi:helix-turn-helix transcriptional regulator [Ralstonia pseudosolanacearum]
MTWVTGVLREFFPFQRVFMAHGMLVAGEITITHWQAHGHEAKYLEQQALTFELEKRGALAWWLANRQPLVIDPDRPPACATEFELQEIRDFDLQNVAAHGILNLKANAGTYFSFAGVPAPLTDWHLDALRILAPVLNDLYLAQLADSDVVAKAMWHLTLRQREIVRRVVAGHSDKVIANDLGIAPQTVRNQLSAVYQRLGVQSRSQLIDILR